MLNTTLLKSLPGCCAMLVATVTFAGSTDEMSKDEWLGKLKDASSTMICKSFTENKSINERLQSANIDYKECLKLIPASFDKCQKKYYSEIPATVNNETADKWGNTLGQCIGTDFATKYFIAKSSTSSDNNTTKDIWLTKLKAVAPQAICTEFLKSGSNKEKLAQKDINYEKCLALLPDIFATCQNQLYATIPTNLDKTSEDVWGSNMGKCIGKDFAKKYLL